MIKKEAPCVHVVSVGTDIVDIKRFDGLKREDRLSQNIFTDREWNDCLRKPHPGASLAARFAAKEAVKKCLSKPIAFKNIEISARKDGTPEVIVRDKTLGKRYSFLVSLSHTSTLAQAFCIALGRE